MPTTLEPMILGEAIRAEIDEIAARLPARRAALLPALHAIQRANGCVSLDAMRELAAHLELEPVDVLGVVTFYDAFDIEPRGRHVVRACTSLACSLRGGRTLVFHKAGRGLTDRPETHFERDGRCFASARSITGASTSSAHATC